MKMRLDDLPVIIDLAGVSVRGVGAGGMLIHKMRFPAGTNFTPLLGEELCPSEHWGVVLEGELHARYLDGSEETVEKDCVYHLRPGHTMWFDIDTSVLEVSREQETRDVFARAQAVAEELMASRAR